MVLSSLKWTVAYFATNHLETFGKSLDIRYHHSVVTMVHFVSVDVVTGTVLGLCAAIFVVAFWS